MECQSSLKQTTIRELKEKGPPNSLRKSSSALICAVVNRSPIKATRNGSMFSLTLCDEDQSSTVWPVCFTKEVFKKIEPRKTYKLEGFKLKKSYGDKTAPELLLDNETQITLSSTQVAMELSSHTIAQILREAANERFLNVKVKVVCVEEARMVGSFPDYKTKRTVSIADSTGHIHFVLWREGAENVSFK